LHKILLFNILISFFSLLPEFISLGLNKRKRENASGGN